MAKNDRPLKYDANRIIGVHGLKRGTKCELLAKLTAATGVIEPKYLDSLEEDREALELRGEYWNEEELKMNFLSTVFKLAMLIAQKENANNKPVYGCYLQGKSWVFTTLHDKSYCVSRSFDATQTPDLHRIIFILRALKQVILTELS